MASPSELTLDYKPNTNTFPLIQKPFRDQPEQTQKLEDFLACLEEERLKIEAFKRELPLCMQLLNNAMETYRRQLETYQSNQGPRPNPVLEEFIPLSNMSINCTEKSPVAPSEKANWMVSAQLWSPASDPAKQQALINIAPMKEPDQSFDQMSTKLALDTKQRNSGAFLPFSKEKIITKGLSSSSASRVLPELSLASVEKDTDEEKKCSEMENNVKRESNGISKSVCHEQGKGGGNGGEGQVAASAGQSTHRKARRCWSPDLHRRFVNALQMLGGSQVATPKQIRELMKVDGLTNDEVKSHLQKYRLHTRRPIQQPQHPAAAAAPQLVVLGGIWVPPEYASSAAAAAAAAAAGGPTIYGTHPGPAAHYPVPQEFYASPPLPHHHHFHRTAVPYKARLPSPDSELRSSGNRSESIEEGEEGEEREVDEDEEEEIEEEKVGDKALVPLDHSHGNGTDMALKF